MGELALACPLPHVGHVSSPAAAGGQLLVATLQSSPIVGSATQSNAPWGRGGTQGPQKLYSPQLTQPQQLCDWAFAFAFTLNTTAATASAHNPERIVLLTNTSIIRTLDDRQVPRKTLNRFSHCRQKLS